MYTSAVSQSVGAVEQFTVNMKEAKRLSTLQKIIDVSKPAMVKFQQEHRAYKFQVFVGIVFHNAVDPTVVAHPPVVLTSEMVAALHRCFPSSRRCESSTIAFHRGL